MRYLLILLTLSACATSSTTPLPANDTCNAGSYASLVGKPATALERVLLVGVVRVIRPGDVVTMDFRQERINFIIDAAGTISEIRCG